MKFLKSYAVIVLLVLTCMFLSSQAFAQEKIGVLFIQHGGFEQYSEQNLFDASAHIFAVRPDHPVHYWYLFNSSQWDAILKSGNGPKEVGKYSFEYERIGGVDPFPGIINTQMALLAQDLQERSSNGTEFVVDYTGWITGSDTLEQFPYPRFLYTAPDYITPFPPFGLTEETISGVTYCGEGEDGGPWPGCNPDRYNVDGPAERFIAAGVDRIIAIDLTTSGVRFFKTYDALALFKMALADNGASIPIQWINDPNALMENSLPTAPVGNWGVWTPGLGEPTADPSVPLADNPNPIAEDTTLAALLTEGAEAAFNSAVPDNATAVLIMNHATDDFAQYFDPKINDTLVLNKNIKNMLLARHPDMDPDNIIGAFMGVKEDGTLEGYAGTERTRNMRGENLGKAWLYETTSVPGTFDGVGLLPGDEWGYKYWDALELLKDRGVEHIVICFPQIVADSVLNMVEIPNQIAKEIGYKSWLEWGVPDNNTYPGAGHPFADYWGIWVDTECADVDNSSLIVDCCFEMGGCSDGRPYPPPRQTTDSRDDLDPSLAYDVSEYGHLGYDPGSGAPDPNSPVQNQYTGTWAMYQPPNDDLRLVNMLADHILAAADPPGGIDIDLDDYDLSVWDFSGSYMQSMENRTLSYILVQDAKGKVTGSGTFDYSSDENDISIPVEIKGTIKGKNNIVTLKYKVKGKDAEGNKIQDDLKLELNENSLSLVGTEKRKICQKGEGCLKIEAEVSLDVPDGMTGEAELEIDVESDESGKKLEGTGELTLSNGDEYPLSAKGKYNSNKEETQFQLKGVADSTKGIKFKLKINEGSDAATFINGKALGQQLKYKLE